MTPIPSISATHLLLAAAHRCQELDSSMMGESLPALAEHLQPIVGRYVAKEGTLPESKTLRAIVRNFNQDEVTDAYSSVAESLYTDWLIKPAQPAQTKEGLENNHNGLN